VIAAILFLALGQSVPQATDSIVVTAKETTDAASAGTITPEQIEVHAEARPGDVLEMIPGMIISQHSGEGKANQYYLRGFNLDHGTDFATTVAGAPVNMPTHAHGQGYSDLNFLIPELINSIQFKKGPYYADEGDFSSAGAANVDYVNSLARPIVSFTGGSFGYMRALVAGSWHNQLLGAFELSRNNGPWVKPDDYSKLNALLHYTGTSWSVTASAYDGRWSSTDQIPDRAVADHFISRFGNIDSSDGGKSHRYSLAGEWQASGDNSLTKANAYLIGYGLQLFSNFTYFLDDPVNGDQFEQVDHRIVAGGRASHLWFSHLFGNSSENFIGVDVRHDHIGSIGLYHTRQREVLDTIRRDKVLETSVGVFAQSTIQWTPKLRSMIGLRADDYEFQVRGRTSASILSPKLTLAFAPRSDTELYVNAGTGFHSNDGRGTMTPLVRTVGSEVGVRTSVIPRLQSTLALWALDIDSELVFAGDTATTEASGASRRTGVEWSNNVRISDHILFDADLAYSKARLRTGDRIPGALEGVASAGVSLHDLGRVSGSLRYRYLGPRPLIEDNSVRSTRSSLVTATLGYDITRHYRMIVDGLNLLNARVSDVDYYYASRLPGEPLGGVNDIHTHPVEPRTLRLRFEAAF